MTDSIANAFVDKDFKQLSRGASVDMSTSAIMRRLEIVDEMRELTGALDVSWQRTPVYHAKQAFQIPNPEFEPATFPLRRREMHQPLYEKWSCLELANLVTLKPLKNPPWFLRDCETKEGKQIIAKSGQHIKTNSGRIGI